jgi:3-hydroxyacyl-[acyl-carrier-protein] dehydratase
MAGSTCKSEERKQMTDDRKTCCQEFQAERQEQCLSISAVFCFPPSLPRFADHFPNMLVLPAIIQLAAIQYLAEVALERPLVPIGYGQTRFRGIISPDEKIRGNLILEGLKDRWAGRFSIRKMDNEVVADGSCTFSPER